MLIIKILIQVVFECKECALPVIATIAQYSQQKLIFQKGMILLLFSPLKVILMLKVIANAHWKTLEELGDLYTHLHSRHQVDASQVSTDG